jgi:hypothetical protein
MTPFPAPLSSRVGWLLTTAALLLYAAAMFLHSTKVGIAPAYVASEGGVVLVRAQWRYLFDRSYNLIFLMPCIPPAWWLLRVLRTPKDKHRFREVMQALAGAPFAIISCVSLAAWVATIVMILNLRYDYRCRPVGWYFFHHEVKGPVAEWLWHNELYLFFALPMPFVLWLIARAVCKASRAKGLCRECGYDLRATPDRCPECGTEPANPGGS